GMDLPKSADVVTVARSHTRPLLPIHATSGALTVHSALFQIRCVPRPPFGEGSNHQRRRQWIKTIQPLHHAANSPQFLSTSPIAIGELLPARILKFAVYGCGSAVET